MKKYEAPQLEVVEFSVEDVVTTSEGGMLNPPPTGGMIDPLACLS